MEKGWRVTTWMSIVRGKDVHAVRTWTLMTLPEAARFAALVQGRSSGVYAGSWTIAWCWSDLRVIPPSGLIYTRSGSRPIWNGQIKGAPGRGIV